jgi:hypothetical protein
VAAVASNISRENGSQPSFDARVPNFRAYKVKFNGGWQAESMPPTMSRLGQERPIYDASPANIAETASSRDPSLHRGLIVGGGVTGMSMAARKSFTL